MSKSHAKENEPEKPASIDPAAVVAMVLGLKPTVVDETLIRAALGGVIAESQNEVARIFGVSPATVRHTWSAAMPKLEATRGKGTKANVAEVLIWLLKRDEANTVARGVDEFSKRKREAETLAAEAEARIKLRRDEREASRFVPVEMVRSEWSGFLSVLRDDVMSIPDDIKPMFPPKQADELHDELGRRLGKALTALADRPVDEFLERLNDDESGPD